MGRGRALAGAVVVALVALAAVGWSARSEEVVVETELLAVPGGPDDGQVRLDTALYRRADVIPSAPAPAILLGHGFGSDRTAVADTATALAADGYVVLTWTARGFGASSGSIHLAAPDAEVADVSALVDVLADRSDVVADADGDPRVGIAGGSYAGGTALLAAAADPRIDAVAAVAAWHDLPGALSPDGAASTSEGGGVLSIGWTSLLFTGAGLSSDDTPRTAVAPEQTITPPTESRVDQSADPACGRFAGDLCAAYRASATSGTLTPEAAALLARGSPSATAPGDAPTLLVHGRADTLFGLTESTRNAEAIDAAGAPVRLLWLPGGHEDVGAVEVGSRTASEVSEWFDRWLRDASPPPTPVFTWVDSVSDAEVGYDALPALRGRAGVGVDEAVFGLSADGRLAGQDDDPATPGERRLVNPPGGQPAAVSSLPGLGGFGGQLPSVDVPGQHVAFDSAVQEEDLVLLGSARLRLELTAAEGQAAFVKLSEVRPGGQAEVIGRAVTPLRLTGSTQELAVELGSLAHRIAAGSRLRLVVATTDQRFPARTEAGTVAVEVGPAAVLTVPVAPGAATDGGSSALTALLATALAITLVLAVSAWRWREGDRANPVDADAPPIVLRGLTKRYADGHLAVDHLDLTVGRGQVFGLLGPNGAGKTSALRMLLGLSAPDAGSVEVLGQTVRPGHPVLRRVGALVEGPGLAPFLSGRQNLVQHWQAGGRGLAEADLDGAVARAALGEAIDKPVATYSHGMRQRLAIAQAMLGRPEVLVLDEPTDGLDPEQIRGLRRRLARLGDQGVTILVSSHLLAEVEQLCTHVAVMQDGRLRASGSVAELVGGTRTVVIATDDRDAARQVLAGRLGAGAVRAQGDGLVVELGGVEVADLLAELLAVGVRVHAVTPRARLEDAFLSLTGGDR